MEKFLALPVWLVDRMTEEDRTWMERLVQAAAATHEVPTWELVNGVWFVSAPSQRIE